MRNRSALHFVVIIGIANFFADFTYEGARGIIGPFLGSLGASAAVVGFVAGLGELMGYGLRSVSGYFADKSHKHWAFAFIGYAINMLAVPALALSRQWPLAASLVVSERVGRGIRKPTVEAMLSYASKSIGARLGIWTERSARSGRRDDRTATYGAGTLSQRRISNRFCCAVHSSFALSCDFGHGAASSPPPARIGSGRWTHPCDSESDASLLDLSRCRRVACCRVCRFRIDRFPLSKGERHAGKFDSRVLCSCNGSERSCIHSIGPVV